MVGPEAPLAAGIADRFAERGRPLFGPTRAAAQLETSKAFAKDFMARHGVPTARYRVCRLGRRSARGGAAIGSWATRVVVKADGLAAGKGVVVAPDRDTAAERRFGLRWSTVPSATRSARSSSKSASPDPKSPIFVVADGERVPAAASPRRITSASSTTTVGPNTGGMGAFCPSPLVDTALQSRIETEIVDARAGGHGERRPSIPRLPVLRV